ncbi:MAG: PorP/SprF family type IX secretion system membrane protein [Paludibacter sp.]
MKKLLFLYFLVLNCTVFVPKCFAQADISMATHWYNRANYNPASIARNDYIYLFSNVQKQWLGVNGSPAVFNVQASGFNYKLNSAFGISLVSDQLGLTQVLNPMLTYAYRLNFKSDVSLSMGISAGVFSRSIDGSQFEPTNMNDLALYSNLETTILPDANIGVELQSSHFVLGVSSTHLFSIIKTDYSFLNSSHLYSYAIYKNTNSEVMNYNVGLQMSAANNVAIMEGNVSVRFKHATGLTTGAREIFDLGISYRSSQQLVLLFGLNVTSNFRIGYAFDQSFSVGYNANSTHEIMLEYRIPSKAASVCHCKCEGNWYY